MSQLTVLTPGAGLDVERAIFDSLAASGVSVDMINVGPDSKHMIVHDEQAATAVRALEPLGVKTELRPRVAKVSIVGAGMHGIPGVMARVVRSLAEVSVRVLQSSDSNLSISCLVDESEVGAAVQALHRAFSLEAE
jgi:aspartate kinase